MFRQMLLGCVFFTALVLLSGVAAAQELSSPPAERIRPELQSRQESPVPAVPGSREPVRLQWKLEPGQQLYQELVVTQKSSCQVQGIEVATGLKYLVLSRFTVEDVASDGTVVILQKIEAARLLEADAMARSVFGNLLTKLSGATFRLTMNPRMEIVALDADEDAFPIVTGGDPMAGQPLMMASLVDRDGWRELNQLTFFQPDRTLKTADRWQRRLTHSWGPLGSWKGEADYRYEGQREGLDRVVYDLKVAHQPAGDQAAAALPFRPANATFQTEKAGGIILFDRYRGRVEEAAETFHVRGSMAIELLGQQISIGIVEQQDFELRVYEDRLGSRSSQGNAARVSTNQERIDEMPEGRNASGKSDR